MVIGLFQAEPLHPGRRNNFAETSCPTLMSFKPSCPIQADVTTVMGADKFMAAAIFQAIGPIQADVT